MKEVSRVCKIGGKVITIYPVSWHYYEAPVEASLRVQHSSFELSKSRASSDRVLHHNSNPQNGGLQIERLDLWDFRLSAHLT